MGKRRLEKLGYNVLTAKDGGEAVRIFKQNQGKIDLAILDLTMPGGGGLLSMNEIKKLAPELPVIISSGYSLEGVLEESKETAQGFLPKPFTSHQMAAMVRKVLTAKKAVG